MIKGSEKRRADYPIDEVFIDRWSPRAMSGEEIAPNDLMLLFEAVRWAPSSFNNQPWRILYARRSTEHWSLFFDLLMDSNKRWAEKAAALLLFISKMTMDRDGSPSKTHSFDTGAAWENLALQGFLKGYAVHAMQGFDYERAKIVLQVPDGFRVEAMVAVGKPGNAVDLPEDLRQRELPNDRRKLTATICEGPFCF